ncbi:uncharacterized protein LOC118420943 [Branchiostoma floridae]|uniref:RNA-directed RNA polymerase n=1 Tax=Branchiostoma floridae TaxID=7739 RepID=A0A9J7MXQ8_BRAFL|nr:uncharacterized protein LOC118420943 [Branchiostoma floridae]
MEGSSLKVKSEELLVTSLPQLKTAPVQDTLPLKGKVHNVGSSESLHYVKEVFFLLSPSFTVQETSTSKGVYQISFVPSEKAANTLSVCKQWCRAVEVGKPYWLELSSTHISTTEKKSPGRLTSLQVLDVVRVSLGCFLHHGTYVSHWMEESHDSTPDISLHLEHDLQSLSVCLKNNNNIEKMAVPYSGLDSFVLVCSRESRNTTLFFPLNIAPRCFVSKSTRAAQEDRVLSFSTCPPDTIGSSSVLALDVVESSTDGSVIEGALRRLEKVGFKIYFSSTRVITAPPTDGNLSKAFDDFSVTYAWRCALSRGYKVSDRALPAFLSTLDIAARKDPIATASALHQVADVWLDGDCFCDLQAAFQTELKNASTIDQNHTEDLPDHYVYARKVVVTPTQMLFLKPEPIVENRVVREYGVDNFIRVAFRDEDFSKLAVTNPNPIRCVTSRVKDVLEKGIRIGERHFKYLGSSNSQMREHGCWMYAAVDKTTTSTSDIRGWMGDLSHERCVATYVSRLGQFFSSSWNAVSVSVEDRSVELIADVETSSGTHTFSDGIGKISVPLAKKVAAALGVSPVPSAFQIRYAGCKGVLAQDPTLGNTDRIQIRGSMKKFESEHKTLEVTSVTTPGVLSLNRQAITLLSGLNVPDMEFLKLQERVLNQLAEMLILDEAAVKALSGARVGMDIRALHDSGISLTTEPFFRSMLLAVYRNRMGELLRRTRIEIPAGEGRIMMGTMDETGKLQYGQVFIQYSREVDKPQADKVVHQGQVTVTKNPCFHPGDMRKFTAVDVPELRHMVDCIVFPSRGPRPHPDEMSGSDLDGDMYFVTWREGLILPRENRPAMDFTAQPKRVLHRPVQESDMIEFFAEYIGSNQLGLIANAHLVHADKEDQGIFSQKCIDLAQLHSDAVDAPKTGQCPELKGDLRPEVYPDFMMKSDKPQYRSERIIGRLFRKCQELDSANQRSGTDDIVYHTSGIDHDLVREGFDSYIEDAQTQLNIYNNMMMSIMSLYGITSEGEVVSGCILKVKQRLGLLKNERFEVTEYVRARFKTLWRKTRAEFFKQFDVEELSEERRKEEQLKRASAWYMVTYSDAYDEKPHDPSPKLLSFPWVVYDVLASLKKIARGRGLEPGQASEEDTNKALISISKSLRGHLDLQLTRITGAQTRQTELFRKIQKAVEGVVGGVKLVLIGPGLTGICDDDSTVEIFVSEDRGVDSNLSSDGRQILPLICSAIKTSVKEATHVKAGKGFTLLFKEDSGAKATVSLTSSLHDLRRSAYIKLHTARRPDLLAVLHVLMDWSRKFHICGRGRDDVIPEEILTLLFLGFAETHDFIAKLRDPDIQTECEAIVRGKQSKTPASIQSLDDGVVLLKFFEHFSSISKRELLMVPDPSMKEHRRPLVDHISRDKEKKLRDNMLHAYHHVAQAIGVFGLLGRQMTAPGHLVLNLCRESLGFVLHAEDFNATRLSDLTGAQVAIRRRMFRDVIGFILEAWGDQDALRRVEEEVKQLEVRSKHPVPLAVGRQPSVQEGRCIVFEGFKSKQDNIQLRSYDGQRNPEHDDKTLESPYLLDGPQITTQTGDGADFELFLQMLRRQGQCISDEYDEAKHGQLRATFRYGNVYVYNTSHLPKTMTVEQFEQDVEHGHLAIDAYLSRVRGKRRGRRRGNASTPSVDPHMQHSFIPCTATENVLPKFLETFNFEEFSCTEKYNVSFKLDRGTKGALILDKAFNFVELRLPDVTWMALDLKRRPRDPTSDDHPSGTDIRLKIQSRRALRGESVEKNETYKKFLDPDVKVLVQVHSYDFQCRDGVTTLQIHPHYQGNVPFVRRRVIRRFRAADDVQHSRFRTDVEVRLTEVWEYSRPDDSGRFTRVIPGRQEVTVIPPLPDWTGPGDVEAFAREYWHFCLELGDTLYR